MRKYIIGAVFGIALSLSISAHAEIVSMINKVVEGTFPVTVDGNKLERDAIVIEGSTYLPVRSFGESIGYDVSFDSGLGVKLSKKAVVSTTLKEVTPTVTPQQTIPKIPITPFDYRNYRQDTSNSELNKVNGELGYRYSVLINLQVGFNGELDNLAKATPENKVFTEDRIAKYNKSIPEEEAKIAELETKKAQLESQTGAP